MMLSILFIVVTSVFIIVTKAACPSGWVTNGINCYQFNVASSVTWQQCYDKCASLGASMLCITDATNNAWVFSQVGTGTWIGYTDLPAKQGSYTWVSGCTSTYSNWNTGEPNFLGTEDVTDFTNSAGKWNNLPPSFNSDKCSCELYSGSISE